MNEINMRSHIRGCRLEVSRLKYQILQAQYPFSSISLALEVEFRLLIRDFFIGYRNPALYTEDGNPCTTSTTRTGDKRMRASPMPVPPLLLRDCIPGELLLCMLRESEFHPRTCFKHKTKSGKNKVQGTILLKSNSAIFDICVIVNVEANDGVIFIRTLDFNVACTTIVFR